MANLNIHLDLSFLNKFRELKLLLKAETNEKTQEKIINIAYKELKEEETSDKKE